MGWVWDARLEILRVSVFAPSIFPRTVLGDGPTAVLPRKSGSANVCTPSPPYVVPSKEKRASFSLIEMICPLQIAQFLGSKSAAKSMMDAR
jgi:hypothetical protein